MRMHSRQRCPFIQSTACVEAPLKDFFVSSALEDALAKIVIVHAQKIAAGAIKRSRRTKILVIILVQFAAGVLPNLVQHSWEIHHAARHFFRASRISRHARVIAVSPSSRNYRG